MPEAELVPEYIELEKAHELVVAGDPILGTTKQTDDDDGFTTPQDAIEPPVSLDALARLSQTNSLRRAIIDAIARNTVGLGYAIQPAEASERDVSDASPESKEIRAKLEACAARDVRLDSPSFTELLMAVKTDEEEVGNGYIEVSRNAQTGLIDGLFHAPGKRMRRLKTRDGWMLLGMSQTTDDAVRFWNFGDKAEYDEQGNPIGIRGGRATRNEILPFRIYTSESRDYGLPRDASMALDYVGDKLAAESNISFFDSSGTPPTVLFVQGEATNDGSQIRFRVPQQTVDRIAGILRSDGGHRHRVAIVPLPAGADVKDVKLGQISEKDMGFTQYRKDNAGRQLGAFRLSPIFVSSVDDSGRYTAEVQRSISLEQVFDPEQTRYEVRLHNTIVKDLGHPDFTIVFKRLAVENDASRRDSAEKAAEVGAITRREYRKAHGMAPLPEAEKSATEIEWEGEFFKSAEPEVGQVPYGWNDTLVRPGGAEPTRVEGDSQQGLRPGIGARRRRQATRDGVDVSAESGAQSARVSARSAGDAAVTRARERAGLRQR
jgi:capsid portal protein